MARNKAPLLAVLLAVGLLALVAMQQGAVDPQPTRSRRRQLLSGPSPPPPGLQHTAKDCGDNFLTSIACAIGSGVDAIFGGIGGLFTPDPPQSPIVTPDPPGAPITGDYVSPPPDDPSPPGDYAGYSPPAVPDYYPPAADGQSPTLIQYEPPPFIVPSPSPPPSPQAILIYASPPPPLPPPPPPPLVTMLSPPPPDAPPPTPLAAVLVPLPNKPTTSLGFNFSLLGVDAATFAANQAGYLLIMSDVSTVPAQWIEVAVSSADMGAAQRRRSRRRLADTGLMLANTLYTTDPLAAQTRINAAVTDGSLQTKLSALFGVQATPTSVQYSNAAAAAPSSSGGSSVPIAAIVGGVVGGIAVLGLVILGLVLWRRKRRAAAIEAEDRRRRRSARRQASRSSGAGGGSESRRSRDFDRVSSRAGAAEGAAALPATKPTAALATEDSAQDIGVSRQPSGVLPIPVDTRAAAYPQRQPSGVQRSPSSASDSSRRNPLVGLANERLAAGARVGGAAGVLAVPAAVAPAGRNPGSPWEVAFSDIQVLKSIGEGSTGRVYLAKLNNAKVAVKVLGGGAGQEGQEGSVANPLLVQKLQKEAGILGRVRNEHVVSFLGFCTSPVLALVTEYCERGSVADLVHAGRASEEAAAALTWRRRLDMAAGAALGMAHLHSRPEPILHRDLKAANLLVTSSWTAKIADFDLSKLVDGSSAAGSSLGSAMNPRWLAPEVLAGEPATAASDVFAFGVVLWELLTWQLPWGNDNPWSIVKTLSEGGRLPIPERDALPGAGVHEFEGLERYVALLQRCWAQNPYDRPRFVEVAQELQQLR